MPDPFIGEIRMTGFNYAPEGWALCDGAFLAISEYQALYALLGTRFGGNGTTDFQLPDLRGRVPLNRGRGNGLQAYDIGQRGGAEAVYLTAQTLPSHLHAIGGTAQAELAVAVPAHSQDGDSNTPGGDRVLAKTPGDGLKTVNVYSSKAADTHLKPFNTTGCVQLSGETGVTGQGEAVENMQPYLAVNFIIATKGVFPPRQ